jgi:signal transduction histidine kinase
MSYFYSFLIITALTALGYYLWIWHRQQIYAWKQLLTTAQNQLTTLQQTHLSYQQLGQWLSELEIGFIHLNHQKQLLTWNEYFEKRFQIKPKLNQSLLETISDHRLETLIDESFSTGQYQKKVIEWNELSRHQHLQINTIEYHLIPEPTTHHLIILLKDETTQKQLEQIRQDFIANASHELRTPLTIIKGYLETLKSEDLLQSNFHQKILHVMDRNTERMQALIEHMLLIAKIENNQELYFAPISAKTLWSEALELLTPMLEKKKIKLKFNSNCDDIFFEGHQISLLQVFINLIQNSIKENEGQDLLITCSINTNNQNIEWIYQDNGLGISAADLPFVFHRFYRGQKHHSQQIKGTGLGLSIVKRVIEAHSGQIHLSSEPGIHTTFTITLPLSQS